MSSSSLSFFDFLSFIKVHYCSLILYNLIMSYLTSFISYFLMSPYHILSYLSNLVFSYIILSYLITTEKISTLQLFPTKRDINILRFSLSLFLSYCFICISYQFLFYMHLCLMIFYTSNLLLTLLSFDHFLLLLLQSPYFFFF